MPIYEAPGKDIKTVAQPAPEEPKVFRCTIADTDQGAECQHCGKALGSGHGKLRP